MGYQYFILVCGYLIETYGTIQLTKEESLTESSWVGSWCGLSCPRVCQGTNAYLEDMTQDAPYPSGESAGGQVNIFLGIANITSHLHTGNQIKLLASG